jgi:hypothetical protein
VSTSFSGAYLITAGIWPFIANGPGSSPNWFQSPRPEAPGTLGYVALGIWVLLALAGISFQLRGRRQEVEVAAQEA